MKFFGRRSSALRALTPGGYTPPTVVPWSTWNEGSETTLGSANNFVCFFDALNAGDNDTGMGGGLSTADRTLIQAGGIVGATGSPLRRNLDGLNDQFSLPQNLIDTTIGNISKTWSIIAKLNLSSTGNDYFWEFYNAAISVHIKAQIAGTNLYIGVEEDNLGLDQVATVAAISTGVQYVAMWADGGTTKVRGGFTTTRPTKWSDFGANNRMTCATYFGDFAGEAFDSGRAIFGSVGAGGSIDADVEYIVMSKLCLIDNGA